jgi:hypothetical protein
MTASATGHLAMVKYLVEKGWAVETEVDES